jgi:predicted nucleotidyltransferase component of viral defense system
MNEGLQLKTYIENQRVSKKIIAEELGMTRQNLYQLFKSGELTPETKKKFINYFKENIFNIDTSTLQPVMKKNPDPPQDQDLNKKYIALLETAYNEKTQLLQKVESNLAQLPEMMVDLTAKAISSQHELSLEIRNGQAVIIEELEALKLLVNSFGKKISRGQKH